MTTAGTKSAGKSQPEADAQQEEKKKGGALVKLQTLLDQYKDQIAAAVPRHVTPERMIRIARTAVSKSPLLQKCDPLTIVGCVIQSSLLGLECDGALGEGYLVPFWNRKARGGQGGYECQFMPGYQGLIKLVRNTDQLEMIDAQAVLENDEFDYEYGFDPKLVHKPSRGNRGAIIGYWAAAVLKTGGKQLVYWSVQEIEDHRDKYSKGAYVMEHGKRVLKDGSPILQGPWKDSPDWMFKKTVLRQLVKLLPKTAAAQLAVVLDEAQGAGIPQRFNVEVPIELHQTSTDEDEEDLANRMRDQTAETGAGLKEKLAGSGKSEAANEPPAELTGKGKKAGAKRSGKKADTDTDAGTPQQPANAPTTDSNPEAYAKFTGEAMARSMGDMPTQADTRKAFDLAKDADVVPNKETQKLYGINVDELSKAAMAHFHGYLIWLTKQKGESQE